VRPHGVFRLAIAARMHELKTRRNIDKVVFVVTHMVECLSHGAGASTAAEPSLCDEEEAVRAVLAYLHA